MPLTLPREPWEHLCRRVSRSTGPVAWRWAAARDHAGTWGLAALLVGVGEETEPFRHRYPGIVLAGEQLGSRAAASRLRHGLVARKRHAPSGIVLPTQPEITGLWLFSDESWRLVPTDWPTFTFSGSVGLNFSCDLTPPLQAPGEPYFPSGLAAVAELVFGAPPGELDRAQPHQVLVRIPDRRGRLTSVEIVDGSVAVGLASRVAGGLDGFVLRAAWRADTADVVWTRKDVEELGTAPVTFATEGVPAEFVATLVDTSGRQIDRRAWNETLGRPPPPAVEELVPIDLLEKVTQWLGEGEHEKLEYKESLSEKQVRVSFAETVAAFANGAGGALLIGVDDEGRAVGWSPAKAADQVANIIGDLVVETPGFTVEEVTIDQKPVVVVTVRPSARDLKPHQVRGRVMVRTWGTTRAATPGQVRALLD